VVIVGGEGSTNELIAQPELKGIKQLKGKTLIVEAPATAYAIQLKAMRLSNGLHEGFDHDLKAIGPTPSRLAAMREHNEYVASGSPGISHRQTGRFRVSWHHANVVWYLSG
jgi:hypothetical protein